MSYIDFNSDLAFGKRFEKYSLESIEPYNKVIFPPENAPFKEWDFEAHHKDGTVVRYEVKTDRRCCDTGNFFIEVQSKYGQPSGLSTTKANVYILIKVDGTGKVLEEYHVDINLMNEFKNDKQFRYVNQPSRGFLLPEKHLLKIYRDLAVNWADSIQKLAK
jgi:hypothetical protein